MHEAVAEGTNETVYNIEVAEFHTYHVGQIGVWVHNDNCGQKRLRSSSEGEDANPRPMERQRLDTEVVAFRRNTRSNTTIDRATDLANRATVDSAPAGNGGGLLEMRTRPSTDGNPTSVKNQARIAELADNKRYKEGAIRTHFKGFRDNQDMTPGIRPYIVESEPRNWTAEHREIRDAMSANLKRRNSFTPFENGSAAENSHLWATSLGGPNDRTNAPPASIHQNTEFLAIEQGLKVLTEQHGDRIRSKVTGYIDPTTGELNSARYKIYHQEDGNWVKKFDHLTDGRRSNIDLEEARGLRDAVQNVVNIPKIGAHAAAVVKGIMINSTAPAREAILAGRGNSIFSPLYTDSDVREL